MVNGIKDDTNDPAEKKEGNDLECRIALVQFEPILGDKEANIKKAVELINDIGMKGADFVCFPEMSSTGYNLDILGDRLNDLAEDMDSNKINLFKDLAKKYSMNIIFPLALKINNKIENSALYINDEGEVQDYYSKSHLWLKEKKYFKKGNKIKVIETKFGKIGMMICYDAGFPEVARTLTLQGAKLIFMPSAWRIQDKDMWDLNISCRALENTVFIAAVNIYGIEGDVCLFGNSKVANPRGRIITQSVNNCEEVVYAVIDLDDVDKYREAIHYLKDRDESLYSQ